jgi:hypothetical protein
LNPFFSDLFPQPHKGFLKEKNARHRKRRAQPKIGPRDTENSVWCAARLAQHT